MSAIATLGGLPVLQMQLSIPITGPWVADVHVDGSTELSGRQTLTLRDDTNFVGTIRRGGMYADSGGYRVVAGAGGLNKTTTPKSYRQTPLSIPLNDILTSAGETIAADAETSVTTANLPNWIVTQTVCGRALSQLLASQSANWRVKDDGTLWVGFDTFEANDQDFILLLEDKRNGKRIIDIDAPSLRPGQTFDGKRIVNVTYELDDTMDITASIWEATS